MGLAGVGNGAALLHRFQAGHFFGAGRGDAFVTRQGGARVPVFLVRHLQGQQHVSLLERDAVLQFQGLLILFIAPQNNLVLLGSGYVPLLRAILRGAGHVTLHIRVLVEIAHHPVLGLPRAPGSQGVRIVQVRAVGYPVRGHGQRAFGHARLDFPGCGRHDPGAGGAGLAHGRPGDMLHAGHGRQPGQAVKTTLLRDGHAQHAVIELAAVQASISQCEPGHMGGEFHAVQVRKTALPLGKRGGPVTTVRYAGFHYGT